MGRDIAGRKHKAEKIINKLMEVEVAIAAGRTMSEAVRRIGWLSRHSIAGRLRTAVFRLTSFTIRSTTLAKLADGGEPSGQASSSARRLPSWDRLF